MEKFSILPSESGCSGTTGAEGMLFSRVIVVFLISVGTVLSFSVVGEVKAVGVLGQREVLDSVN